MRFVNHTPLPSALVPCAEGGDDLTALVISCVTFAITPVPEGKTASLSSLRLAYEQRPLERGSARLEPGDDVFVREGVSVTATGFVYAPAEKATKADASLSVGNEVRRVRAFGPRVWREGMFGTLSPTSPLVFDRVPMTWEAAYGGTLVRKTSFVERDGRMCLVPEYTTSYPHNADGVGFYLERSDAVEKPLPQLEHPELLIKNWDNKPHPVCFAPYAMNGGMRPMVLSEGDKVNLNRLGKLTCRAAPWLIFSTIEPGTNIVLTGMRPKGETLSFVIPEAPIRVRAILGRALFRMKPRLDAVEIDAEAALLRLVYRCPFKFGLVQHERREVFVEPSEHFPEAPKPPRTQEAAR
jgi:Uncharacterized protein conserved in bacteria (DUF2169)